MCVITILGNQNYKIATKYNSMGKWMDAKLTKAILHYTTLIGGRKRL